MKKLIIATMLLFCFTAVSARSVKSVINKIDNNFYYPQKAVKSGFKLRVKYSAVDQFLKNNADKSEGEKAGKYYAVFNKKNNQFNFDVSSISKRIAPATNAMLMEIKDSIMPRSIKDSLKKYQVKLHYEKSLKQYRLIAFLKKKKYKRPPPIVRVEYYLNKKFKVQRVSAFLMSGERVESKWTLQKAKNGKSLIKENSIIYILKRGKVHQITSYIYTIVKGVHLPAKVTTKSRFEYGKEKVDTIDFLDHQVY